MATSCYGVKGMAVRSKTDGLVHLLRRESMSKGVKVINHEDGAVTIELHIIVDNGVNLTEISRSIMNRVKYDVHPPDWGGSAQRQRLHRFYGDRVILPGREKGINEL